MCGIVGVVRRRATRPVPDAAALVRRLDEALAAAGDGIANGGLTDTVREMAAKVEAVDRELRGVPGVRALLGDPQSALLIGDRVDQLTAWLDRVEAELDGGLGPTLVPAELEQVNATVVRARDAVWAVSRDRLRTAREVGALAGPDPSIAAIEASLSVQVALSAIDRLEVRGRDSAGLHLLVRHHGLDLDEPAVGRLVALRADDPLFGSGLGAGDGRRDVVRVQGGRRDRRAGRQHRGRCATPSAMTRCCTSRWPIRPPR